MELEVPEVFLGILVPLKLSEDPAFLHHRKGVLSYSFSSLSCTLLLFDIWGEGQGLSQFSCSSFSFRQILYAGTDPALIFHWRVLSPSKIQVIWLHCNFSFITAPPPPPNNTLYHLGFVFVVVLRM